MDDKALARAKARADAREAAMMSESPSDEPKLLFKIERREVIGQVFSDPFSHGKPPIITAFQIVGEHINNMNNNGDRSFAKFEFEYDDQGFTIERETFPPSI